MFKKRYKDQPVHPRSQTNWQTQQEDGENFLAGHVNHVNLDTHYNMLKEVSNDINELRRELRGFESIKQMKMYDIQKAQEKTRQRRLEDV